MQQQAALSDSIGSNRRSPGERRNRSNWTRRGQQHRVVQQSAPQEIGRFIPGLRVKEPPNHLVERRPGRRGPSRLRASGGRPGRIRFHTIPVPRPEDDRCGRPPAVWRFGTAGSRRRATRSRNLPDRREPAGVGAPRRDISFSAIRSAAACNCRSVRRSTASGGRLGESSSTWPGMRNGPGSTIIGGRGRGGSAWSGARWPWGSA